MKIKLIKQPTCTPDGFHITGKTCFSKTYRSQLGSWNLPISEPTRYSWQQAETTNPPDPQDPGHPCNRGSPARSAESLPWSVAHRCTVWRMGAMGRLSGFRHLIYFNWYHYNAFLLNTSTRPPKKIVTCHTLFWRSRTRTFNTGDGILDVWLVRFQV